MAHTQNITISLDPESKALLERVVKALEGHSVTLQNASPAPAPSGVSHPYLRPNPEERTTSE